jgi:hypothetical protein
MFFATCKQFQEYACPVVRILESMYNLTLNKTALFWESDLETTAAFGHLLVHLIVLICVLLAGVINCMYVGGPE